MKLHFLSFFLDNKPIRNVQRKKGKIGVIGLSIRLRLSASCSLGLDITGHRVARERQNSADTEDLEERLPVISYTII